MEIVQSDTEAMLIIDCNEEALSYLANIPTDYQEVERIGIDIWPYIDTWLKAKSSLTIQLKYKYTRQGWGCLIWGYSSESDDFRYFVASWTTYLDWWNASQGNWRINCSYVSNTTTVYETEIWNHYIKDLTTWTTKVSWNLMNFTKWYNVRIWRSQSSDTEWGQFHYVKIYDNWTLVRNFYACYRKSDNVIGLYDKVNDVFYTNQWSWSFTKWPDYKRTD